MESCFRDETRPERPTNFVAKQPVQIGAKSLRRTRRLQSVSQRPKPAPRMKQLLFDPKVDRRLQLDEEWRAVAKSYLLDSRFSKGIQSLNLKDPQMLEKAVIFVKNPSSRKTRENLCSRARRPASDFDRNSKSSKSNEYTDMWLRMAVVILQIVMGRKATHPEDFRGLVNVLHHYMIVTDPLLEVLADWNSSPDSFLKRNYLSDIDGSNERSGRRKEHDAEEQTGVSTTQAVPRVDTADEAIEEADAGQSMLGELGDETRADHGVESEEVAETPDPATHPPDQQTAAPTAIMFIPTQHQTTSPSKPTTTSGSDQATVTGPKQAAPATGVPSDDDGLGHEKQDIARHAQDSRGSAPDSITEAEGTTTKGLRSMLDDERKKRKQAKHKAKTRIRELEKSEQKAKDKRKRHKQAERKAKARIRELEKSEQEANVRIRELEQKLKRQEARSSSGIDESK